MPKIPIELCALKDHDSSLLAIEFTYKGEFVAALTATRMADCLVLTLTGVEGGSKGVATFGARRIAAADLKAARDTFGTPKRVCSAIRRGEPGGPL